MVFLGFFRPFRVSLHSVRSQIAVTLTALAVALGLAPTGQAVEWQMHPTLTRTVTVYFLGDDQQPYDVVARVKGRRVVGWIVRPESDDTACFRGTVKNGKLVGKTFKLSPETGEWYVGPLIVRGSGTGPRFQLTSIRFTDVDADEPTWHRPLIKTGAAEANAARWDGYTQDMKRGVAGCAQTWRENS